MRFIANYDSVEEKIVPEETFEKKKEYSQQVIELNKKRTCIAN